MILGKRFEAFVEHSPVSVMARAGLERALDANRLNALFERTAQTQYTRELLFSTVVRLMSEVVLGVSPSVHAAYQDASEPLEVSVTAVYDKLAGVEPEVSAELVRDSARNLSAVIEELVERAPRLLEGYRVLILDGNHLSGTEHRIQELRRLGAAALPGQALVVLDPALMLIVDVLAWEDADARQVARLYLQRWTIERVFQDLTVALTCEVRTLGYPKAALFGFCLALVAYNAVSLIQAALRAVHGTQKVQAELSWYYLCVHLSKVYTGMMIAVPGRSWDIVGHLDTQEFAALLKELAARIDLRRFRKHPRGPKKPPPKKISGAKTCHVATARILAKRSP